MHFEQFSFTILSSIFIVLAMVRTYNAFIYSKYSTSMSNTISNRNKCRCERENQANGAAVQQSIRTMNQQSVEKVDIIKSIANAFLTCNYSVLFVGIISETYLFGSKLIINFGAVCIGYLLVFLFFLPFVYNLDKSITSPYLYLQKRYNENIFIRITSAFVGFFFYFSYITLMLWGIMIVLSTILFDLSILASGLVAGILSLIGCFIGGLEQSIKSSAIQFILLFLSIIAALIGTIKANKYGKNLSQLWSMARKYERLNIIDTNIDLRIRYTIWNQLFSLPFPWIIVHLFTMSNFTKYRSISTLARSRALLILNAPIMLIINILLVFAGIFAFMFFYACDPLLEKSITNKNQIVPYWAIKALSESFPFVGGAMLACVFTYSLCFHSKGIVQCADTILNEMVYPLIELRSQLSQRLLKSVLVLLLGLLSIVYAISFKFLKNSILSLYFIFAHVLNAPLLGLFILSMFNPYANAFGANLSFLINIAINVWLALGLLLFSRSKSSQELPFNTFLCNKNGSFQNMSMLAQPLVSYPKDPTLLYLYSISSIWYSLFSVLFVLFFGTAFSILYSIIRTKTFDCDSEFREERKRYLFKLSYCKF
jgi:hypothetical protein